MRAHRTPARRPYMAGGAARRAWPEESGRGVDRDGVLTAGRTAGPREGGPGLPLEERLLRSFPRSVSAPRPATPARGQYGVAHCLTLRLSLYCKGQLAGRRRVRRVLSAICLAGR